MSYYTNNIGYKQMPAIGTKFIPIYTGEPISSVIATAGATLIASWNDWFTRPAFDANRLINSIKPQLANSDARQRLALVIATSQKISPRARDVGAEKLFLWYKNTYNEDYKTLSLEDKEYYNKFLQTAIQTQADGNNFWANSQRAMFTNSELNYNANPVQAITNTASNIFTNLTKSPSSLILYTGIGLGLYLILKNK
jgi:hypothetical protein